jgi:hypothetical protein
MVASTNKIEAKKIEVNDAPSGILPKKEDTIVPHKILQVALIDVDNTKPIRPTTDKCSCIAKANTTPQPNSNTERGIFWNISFAIPPGIILVCNNRIETHTMTKENVYIQLIKLIIGYFPICFTA